jgi:hypothetical protein
MFGPSIDHFVLHLRHLTTGTAARRRAPKP